ncbi:unnamed protein product [marine sediment metagenome]|uniref:Uncharacterized protein n=1 Tax=marine sediment metagenome TaxID=412755 RepID=X0U8J8_9ZZZZ
MKDKITGAIPKVMPTKEKYTIPKEFHDKKISEQVKMTKEEEKTLSNELSNLLNRYSRENDSNTPDFILANYMMMCLRAGEYLVNMREQWKNK